MMVHLEGQAGSRDARLELDLVEHGPVDSPGEGDILLDLVVDVGGYAAADQVWILHAAFVDFQTQLAALEKRRQGTATLEGLVDTEFGLTIYSTDRTGHMAVRGHGADRTSEGHNLQLRFGFAFEPDLLPMVVSAVQALSGR